MAKNKFLHRPLMALGIEKSLKNYTIQELKILDFWNALGDIMLTFLSGWQNSFISQLQACVCVCVYTRVYTFFYFVKQGTPTFLLDP